ncbi:Fic family protein [Niabella yanshanensis]|uniref:Fic family protein n=1 Tax=Niabella yanshanensis TaxID=577386 RepID=A0ABZ0W5C0_9BACT|nr:Fic family protein [Niabella yanshanensis]WQD36707.1 Fic family protein [Niabella yanshanensis]
MMQPLNDDPARKLVSNLNNNYVHWDKFKDMQIPEPDYRMAIWAKALAERDQGFYRRLSFPDLEIKWWISNGLEAQLHQLDIGLAGGRDLQVLLEPKHVHRHKTNALLDESITSAQLAGVTVSKKAAKEMLLKKRTPQDVNEQVCVNIYKALQLAYARKEENLSVNLLLQLHQTLTRETIKLKGVGQYRTNNKVDLSAVDVSAGYKPADTLNIPSIVEHLMELYNNDTEPCFIHPLVKAGLLHYVITTARPFKDGNGRIARLLAQMYLWRKGYWVAEFISVSNIISKFRPQYHKTFSQAQTDENNSGYFIQFYIQSVQMAFKSLRDFASRISREKIEKPGQKIPGYNERQTTVLQWLKEDGGKVITIRELRSVYGVSKETARTDLTALVENGWLKYYNINKKTYAFVKAEGFDELMRQC